MNRTVVRLGAGWSKGAQWAASALVTALIAAGCGGGGGGGGGNGITDQDEHGDIPLNATVVIPDGRNIKGQINYPTDRDWFKYRGIQGISYVFQITGFPPDPNVRLDLDLTGNGTDALAVQILDFTAATQTGQLENTTGAGAGEPYDIDPLGVDDPLFVVGDSRIFWTCPTTNDYFFVIAHRRTQTGIGAYEVRLATSQLMTIDPNETQIQTGARFFEIFDDQGVELWDNWIVGGVDSGGFEYIESINTIVAFVPGALGDRQILLPNQDEPEPYFVHFHTGFPDIYNPISSDAQPPSGENHPIEHSQQDDSPTFFLRSSSDVTLPLADGSGLRVPIEMMRDPADEDQTLIVMSLDDAVSDSGTRDIGADEFLDASTRRTFHGWPWYYDVHPMDSQTVPPVATSLPNGDLYQFFETNLLASPGNVVFRDGATRSATDDRGFGVFSIFYDAALKTFQVAMQQYQIFPSGGSGGPGPSGFDVGDDNVLPPVGFIIDPDYTAFVGDRVRVHSGGPGENGPVLIDLGTLPAPRLPDYDFQPGDLFAEPGFRNPIRQLTDAEAEDLRDAFYGDGFYVEVTDSQTGEPLVRAEGLLEISVFPFLEPCSFPPCSSIAPENYEKGVATFATGLQGVGPMDLYVNGELLGALTETVTAADLPACGLAGDGRTLAAELWPGTYYWHAHGKDGASYDGHVTVPSGGCALVVISEGD